MELAELITDCVKWGKASNGRYLVDHMMSHDAMHHRSIEFLPKILSLVSVATTVPVRGIL